MTCAYCDRAHHARGLCHTHYKRARRHPDTNPNMDPTPPPPIEDVIEDVEWMTANGETAEHIVNRLGTTADALRIRLKRAGRMDLAGPFNALNSRLRAARKAA